MDLEAVRTFVMAADAGQFQEAAAELAITQQAVSKRVASLEADLAVRLFTRTARGAQLTIDGQAFLPRARELLRAEQRATDSVRPGRRTMRVDIISRRIAPAALLRDFHRARPDIELDVMTLGDSGADTAVGAVASGTIDASFRAITMPPRQLPDGIETVPAIDESHQLLTGPAHELAAAQAVTPADLAGHRIWIPGILPGTEWATYYDDLADAFGLTIDRIGPNFGTEPLLDVLADSATLATLVGEHTRLLWPADYDLRRIPVHDPTPVYPHSLIWHRDNPHPGLTALREYLGARQPRNRGAGIWAPAWAQPPARTGSRSAAGEISRPLGLRTRPRQDRP